MLSSKTVAIASTQQSWGYPTSSPFYPDENYPELKGRVTIGAERNITYELIRQIMRELEMDINNYSTPEWNPFGKIIRPGQKVLIKPNLVRHLHLGGGDYQAVVTHPSLVRCVLDYVAIALRGRGEITVGDAPVQSTDFSILIERTGLKKICDDVSQSWGIPIRLVDFRLWSVRLDDTHHIISGNKLNGDSAGYISVNIGALSLLNPLNNHAEKFRVTNYDCGDMRRHHNTMVHEYLIPQTVLDADVVINLPKLKTHRKVGLTAALKNLVGINGHKDWLPHHRCGSTLEGGDEYKESSLLKKLQSHLIDGVGLNPYSKMNVIRYFTLRLTHRLIRYLAPDPFIEGSWYGNDTLWRTVLDLNRLLVYADHEGKMRGTSQRQCLTIVDAIIAGEGEGPMEPDARQCGFLAGGGNPLAVDAVLATMIGFDYKKIPLIEKGFAIREYPIANFRPDEIEVRSQESRWGSLKVGDPCYVFNFTPPSGWVGHIESVRQTVLANK